jgi:hypothetical protein
VEFDRLEQHRVELHGMERHRMGIGRILVHGMELTPSRAGIS